MAAGNWTPELVRIAGGTNLVGEVGLHSPRMSWDDLSASDPDVIVVAACGFDLARTRRELGPLLAHPSWPALRAVRAGRVFVADGNAYFNRSGPRLVESLEILAELLHPERFAFGHRGTGWDPL
jgi:iron complex transport system substrate-binding protein